MKTLFFLFLLSLSCAAAAQNVSGFYTGTLYNDSTKMIQKYELALSDYRGKIDGYSYVTFVKNDTFYYGIRKEKARIVGDSLILQEDKMISNNFPEPPAKGVGRTITIPLRGQDSLVIVSGSWKTNQTKKYYSVPGVIDLNRSSDSTKSPLIAHLQELNLIETPVYYQNMRTQPLAVADTKKEKKDDKTSVPAETTASRNTRKNKESAAPITSSTPKEGQGADPDNKQSTDKKDKDAQLTAKSHHPTGDTGTPSSVKAEGSETTASTGRKSNDRKNKQSQSEETTANTNSVKTESSTSRKDEIKKEREQLTTVKKENKADGPTAPVLVPYTQRKNKTIQTIEVGSDSLILAFYDNGVVDGDSVSVYLNNETFVSNMKLNTVATKRMIPIKEGQDTELLLVAENMGRIPPNTGLITIRDGENYHQVHFSADLQTNATIVIRRKKKQ